MIEDPSLELMRRERVKENNTQIVHTREEISQEIEDLVKRLAVSLGRLEAANLEKRVRELETRPTPIVEASNDGGKSISREILQMIVQALPIIDDHGERIEMLERGAMAAGSISHNAEWAAPMTELMELLSDLQSKVLTMQADVMRTKENQRKLIQLQVGALEAFEETA